MAFVCNGSGHLVRDYTGGFTSVTNYTLLMAVKRTSLQASQKALCTLRPASEASGHNVFLYNGGFGSDAAPVLRANYGAADADPNTILPLDEHQWVAIQGNGTTAWIRQLVAGTWVSASCAQVDFVDPIEVMRICDTGEGTQRLTAKISHIREWDDFLSEAELTTETNSQTPVLTTGLVSAKRGVGANLAAALTGESGEAYTTSGTVTLDADEPTFTATAEAAVAQTLEDFSDTLTLENPVAADVTQTIADFSQTATLALDQLSAVIEQTIDDFSNAIELSQDEIVAIAQALEDFVQVMTAQGAGIPATPAPEYTAVTCGPGSYGTPVNSAHRSLKREIHRPWPTR